MTTSHWVAPARWHPDHGNLLAQSAAGVVVAIGDTQQRGPNSSRHRRDPACARSG